MVVSKDRPQPAPSALRPEADVSVARVFISYSRKDIAFVDRLDVALRERSVEATIDRQDIYAFEDWWRRIQGLIAEADTILFVLSPDAVASKVCREEVAFAASLNKRFAPIVARTVHPAELPAALSRLNFVSLDGGGWAAGLDRLVEALATDIDWVRRHSEFGALAHRWAEEGRPATLLLRARSLEETQRWIASRPANAPAPTEDTQALVIASRSAARTRRRTITAGLVLGLVLALALAGLALWQRQIAVANEGRAVTAQVAERRALESETEQRKIAERQREIATERERQAARERERAERSLDSAKAAADGLIFDLARSLGDRGLPIPIVREVLARAEELMDRLVRSEPDNPVLLRSQGTMYSEFAETYGAAGATGERALAATRSLAIRRRLAEASPANDGLASEFSLALMQVGDAAVMRGETDEALDSYEQSLVINRRLGADPMAREAANLSPSLRRLGTFELDQGNILPARQHLSEAVGVSRRRLAPDPDSTGTLRELMAGVQQVARLRDKEGDMDLALSGSQESVGLARRLVGMQPSSLSASRELVLSLMALTEAHASRGQMDAALAAAREALAIGRRLVAADASNAMAAGLVAASFDRIAGLQLLMRDVQDRYPGTAFASPASFEDALRYAGESVAIRRRLAASDPTNRGAVTALAEALRQIARVSARLGQAKSACEILVEARATIATFLAGNAVANTAVARDRRSMGPTDDLDGIDNLLAADIKSGRCEVGP